MNGSTRRAASGVVVGALVLLAVGAVSAPATLAGEAARCRVRNVTQSTAGRNLGAMVEAARAGDHLRVRGVCRGDVLIDKNLVIRGARGGAVLRGGRVALCSRRCVPETVTVRLVRLVIERGWGVSIDRGSEATLVDSVVRRNRPSGIRIGHGLATLVRTIVSSNRVDEYGEAGGLEISNGRVIVRDSVVVGNWGSGIYIDNGFITIRDSLVVGNTGGGIEAFGAGTMRIADSVVADNAGLGFSNGAKSATIVGSLIARNSGGGIAVGNELTLRRSRVVDNTTDGDGGGILNLGYGGTLWLVQSTVRGNTAGGNGGGIHNSGTLRLVASRIRYNTALEGGGIYNEPPGTVTLDADSSVTNNVPDDCVGTSAC